MFDDMRKLRALREVADRGSFSEAAARLSYTQSAISQQIAQLEKQVGVPLLDRSGKLITPTAAGHTLIRHAERALSHLAAAASELHGITGRGPSALRVVAVSCTAATWLPRVLQSFREAQPGLAVSVTTLDSRTGILAVESGRADIAVITLPHAVEAATSGATIVELMHDPLELMVSAAHPLAAQAHVELAQLADEAWILGSGGDAEIATFACRRAGFIPRIAALADDVTAVCGLVAAGLGNAILPAMSTAAVRPDDVVTYPTRLQNTIVAVVADPVNPTVAHLLELVEKAAAAWEGASGVADPGTAGCSTACPTTGVK